MGAEDSGDHGPGPSHADQGAIEPWETSFENKKVVICLGNTYMRDDGAGVEVARALRGRGLGGGVFIHEESGIGLSLLWQFRGAKKIIVIDALRSGLPPGTVTKHVILPGEGKFSGPRSLHELELFDLFDLAAQGDLRCPIVIVGVEPKDCGLGEGLSAEVAGSLPGIVEEVIRELLIGSEDR